MTSVELGIIRIKFDYPLNNCILRFVQIIHWTRAACGCMRVRYNMIIYKWRQCVIPVQRILNSNV